MLRKSKEYHRKSIESMRTSAKSKDFFRMTIEALRKPTEFVRKSIESLRNSLETES